MYTATYTPNDAYLDTKDKLSESCISDSTTTTASATSLFIDSLSNDFNISNETETKICNDIFQSIIKASTYSKISMIPCFQIPRDFHHETDLTGEFIVIDIGGSTIRIGIIDLSSPSDPIIIQREWFFSEKSKIIDISFFNDLVLKTIEVLKSHGDYTNKHWNIGMTWSFPLDSKNQIITMGKGFHITQEVSGIGIDQIVSQICHTKGLNADVVAVINDSIAVNLSGLLDVDMNSKISFILGTGVNSCITKDHDLINTELGFFGKLFNVTKYDSVIDQRWTSMAEPYINNSTDERIFQPLEFLASGRYISEIFRLILWDLIQENLVSVEIGKCFKDAFSLNGELICLLLSNDFSNIKEIVSKKYSVRDLSDEEILLLQSVIDIILERSAIYVSCSIKAAYDFAHDSHNKDAIINVNYIGSFLYYCQSYQDKIIKHSGNIINLNHVESSSLLGAAVAACMKVHPPPQSQSLPAHVYIQTIN